MLKLMPLKFNIMIENWPFCNTNNLRLEVLTSTSADNAVPLMYSEDGGVDLPELDDESDDAPAPAPAPAINRKLLQAPAPTFKPSGGSFNATLNVSGVIKPIGSVFAGYGKDGSLLAVLDKFKSEHKRPTGKYGDVGTKSKLATFLVNRDKAAAMEIQNYAYDTVDGTRRFDVTVNMMSKPGDNTTKLVRTFPFFGNFGPFGTLFYDPSMSMTSPSDAGYTSADSDTASPAPPPPATPAPTPTPAPKKNAGAVVQGSMYGMLHAVLLVWLATWVL
eukprot:jgi/Chrzof1/1232/Cz01g45190.t1